MSTRWFKLAALGAALFVAAAGCGPSSSASALASIACVAGVSSVAGGTNGSLYIQDDRGIVHYSRKGKLLSSFGSSRGDWAVDISGDVYYLRGRDIVKVTPRGTALLSFPAPMMEPEAVNYLNGDILAVYGGSGYAGTGPDPFELFSPTGRLIHRWSPSYAAEASFDRRGDIVATAQTNAELIAVNPVTGKTTAITPPGLGAPYDAVGSDNHGHIFIGGENGSDTPFIVEKVTVTGHHFRFKTLNSGEESVGGLTVATDGSIYVIRSSYSEPSPSDTGLEELSPSGSSEGKFAVCRHS